MNVSIVGFGKLGAAIGVAMAHKGHRVLANDICPERVTGRHPYNEQGYEGWSFDQLRERAQIQFAHLPQLVLDSDLIFVVVQTPHGERFDGTHLLRYDRADFDYGYLRHAVQALDAHCRTLGVRRTVAVMSTVLPGTIRREILPLCENVDLVYNPAFPAMGTAVRDFLTPEFVLIGTPHECSGMDVSAFYRTITLAPQVLVGYETAEAIKVLYNTYITSKITFANAAMELCHKVGANVDDVSDALGLATRRITSPAYMRGGMGDGGACHPRDLIAMSWLARKMGLSFDLFDSLAKAREYQAWWLCDLVLEQCVMHDLTPFILGTAFKAGSNIEIGSAALLCKRILEIDGAAVETWDPHVDNGPGPTDPHVFLVGCNHPELADYPFPTGSVVVDPWRMVRARKGVTVVRVGQ